MTHILGDGNRKSKYNPDLDKVLIKEVEEEKRKKAIAKAKGKLKGKEKAEVDADQEKDEENQNPPTDSNLEFFVSGRHNTYGIGLHKFRDECKADTNNANQKIKIGTEELIRPPTIKEILEYKLIQFNRTSLPIEEREKLFNQWFETSTGIAYQKDTNKFKIVPVSLYLMQLPKDFNKQVLSIPYSGIPLTNGVVELDRTKDKYGIALTKVQAEKHKGWIALCEGNENLLKEYVGVVYGHFKKSEAMWFWLADADTDHLRSVYVNGIGDSSGAGGNVNLGSSAYFLRVTQAKNFSIGSGGRK